MVMSKTKRRKNTVLSGTQPGWMACRAFYLSRWGIIEEKN